MEVYLFIGGPCDGERRPLLPDPVPVNGVISRLARLGEEVTVQEFDGSVIRDVVYRKRWLSVLRCPGEENRSIPYFALEGDEEKAILALLTKYPQKVQS